MNSRQKPALSQVLAELKEDYLRVFPEKIRRLHTLTEQRDWDGLEIEYHKLKGSGKTYGFPEVSVVCEKLEALATQKSDFRLETFEQALPLLQRMYDAYLHKKKFPLEQDVFARSLLALKLN